MLQRLVLYATLGWVLDLNELGWTTWGFWCVLALFMASEWMTRRELIEEIEAEVAELRRRRAENGKD
jgi:hypothetical protein